ncbi:hypothetical protein OG612_18650 [Streptomyces sp. NBC_01527]|uniref:hypothetical protein n=1 Tax=Streptomyces sp. NBC_01527 TaxID=2903894 RepID=UPI00386C3296
MSAEILYAWLVAELERLTAELRSMTPRTHRPYRPWLHLSTAERAAEIYFTAERNRVAAELRGAEERLEEFERVRATLPPLAFRLWVHVRCEQSAASQAA